MEDLFAIFRALNEMSSHVSKAPRLWGTYSDRIRVNANSPGYSTSLSVSRMGLQVSRIKLNFELLSAGVWKLARFLAKNAFFYDEERERERERERVSRLFRSTKVGISALVNLGRL